MLATGNTIYPAIPSEVLWSDDLVNWTSVYTNSLSFYTVAYGNNKFIAAGYDGTILQSTNATNWINPTPTSNNLFFTDLVFLNSQFVGLNSEHFWYSSNGTAWTATPMPTNTGYLYNLTYGKGRYVAGGDNRTVWTSTNGADWSNPATNLSRYPYTAETRVAFGNGVFVGASGSQADVLTSPDGLNWMVQTLTTNDFDYVYFGDVTFANGRFVAVAATALASSLDGTNWFLLRTNLNLSKVTGGAGRFVAVGGSTLATSTDGTNWFAQFTGDPSPLNDVAFGAGWFVATTGLYYSSPTLIKQPRPYWISQDGVHWRRCTFDTPQGMGPIAFGDGTFIAGMERGGLLQSDPFVTLELKASPALQLNLSGPRYRQYRIESLDLTNTTPIWGTLSNLTVTTDTATITDPGWLNRASRFYRAVLLP